MNEDLIISQVKEISRSIHAGSLPSHDFSHIERVYCTAKRIAQAEQANLFIVSIAALLHDIGRVEEAKNKSTEDIHEKLSVQMAGPILDKLIVSIDGPPGTRGSTEIKNAILYAIMTHRRRHSKEPQTIEAKCLFDADKLDSLGAVGIARCYLWLGENGRGLYYPNQREWDIKIKKLKNKMYTTTGKKIAQARHERMARIINEIEKEVMGQDEAL